MEGNIMNAIKASDLIKTLNEFIEGQGDNQILMFVETPMGSVISPICGVCIREVGYDKDHLSEFICITNEIGEKVYDEDKLKEVKYVEIL